MDTFAAEDLPSGTATQKVTYEKFSGLYGEFIAKDKFWRKWWLRHVSLLIFVTYNCGVSQKDTERNEVDEILRTLK